MTHRPLGLWLVLALMETRTLPNKTYISPPTSFFPCSSFFFSFLTGYRGTSLSERQDEQQIKDKYKISHPLPFFPFLFIIYFCFRSSWDFCRGSMKRGKCNMVWWVNYLFWKHPPLRSASYKLITQIILFSFTGACLYGWYKINFKLESFWIRNCGFLSAHARFELSCRP